MNTPNEQTPVETSAKTDHGPQTPAQQGASMPIPTPAKPDAAKWQLQISAAKVTWNKLTEAELVKSEGEEQKLSGLVKERYAVSQDEANKQVKAFLLKQPA